MLKQRAIQDGSAVSMATVRDHLEARNTDQLPHLLVAFYYAAKADPDVPGREVDSIRELVHEQTGYVDTSHKPTVRRILDDVLGE